MFATSTSRLRLFALALPVFAVGLVRPAWAQSVGLDVWNVPALQAEMRASADASDRLDEKDHEVQQRMAVKESLVAELIAGRTTLAEVTARFTDMNATRPDYVASIRATFSGTTDLEKSARNVIDYALARVPVAERAAFAARLEAELQQMLVLSSH